MTKSVSLVGASKHSRRSLFLGIAGVFCLAKLAACGGVDATDAPSQSAAQVESASVVGIRNVQPKNTTPEKIDPRTQGEAKPEAAHKDGTSEARSYSFLYSCINVNWGSSVISADCRRRNGSWNNTSIETDTVNRCGGDIANEDGFLMCSF